MDKKLITTGVVLLLLLIGGTTAQKNEAVAEFLAEFMAPSSHNGLVPVVRVVDGDTVILSIDGRDESVRLIGLDTPETVDPRKPVQCFGKEASEKAKTMLTDKRVRIERDPSQSERDKYDRLLVYLYLEDGTLFNKYMIEEGYGHEYTYITPYIHQQEFKSAEAFARTAQKGLWAPGVCE